MSEYIVCVDDLEESYYRLTDIKPETVFGHRLREEIVRCRDCKRYHPAEGKLLRCRFEIDGFVQWRYAEPDGFCAWSCRRSDAR